MLQCVNEKSLSVLKYTKEVNKCGHWTKRLSCDNGLWQSAENLCCRRYCHNMQDCKGKLDHCLSTMFDEGKIVLDTGITTWTPETGHYWNMISPDYGYVVCGFGFDDQNLMVSMQNYYWNSD